MTKRPASRVIQSLNTNTNLSDLKNQIEKNPNIETENQEIEIQETKEDLKEKKKDDFYFLKKLKTIDSENKGDKGYVYISSKSHNRLKTLSNFTNMSISEITDSIINDFLEKNKDQINTAIKKNQANFLF